MRPPPRGGAGSKTQRADDSKLAQFVSVLLIGATIDATFDIMSDPSFHGLYPSDQDRIANSYLQLLHLDTEKMHPGLVTLIALRVFEHFETDAANLEMEKSIQRRLFGAVLAERQRRPQERLVEGVADA